MNLRHYRDYGWAPSILAVCADAAARPQDTRLAASIPDDVEVHRVGAFPERLGRKFGVSAIGIRAYYALARAGDALLRRERFDLAFFSTTAFPAMALGPRWLRRFGLPFVLDFQDPWHTASTDTLCFRRRGLKHRAMQALHRRLEGATVPRAAGLVAVSPHYIAALKSAYPGLRLTPAEAIPFGHSVADGDLARALGRPWEALVTARREGRTVALSAGRAGAAMVTSLRSLFALVAAAPSETTLGQLRLFFLGTGYKTNKNPSQVAPIAAAEGLGVVEAPDRLPLIDTLRTLEEADLLLIFGSDDLAYQPSKLHQYLAIAKPVMVVAPPGSRLATQVADLPGVVYVETGGTVDAAAARRLSDALDAALALGPNTLASRCPSGAPFEATVLAARECAVFDAAHAYGAATEGGSRVHEALGHG